LRLSIPAPGETLDPHFAFFSTDLAVLRQIYRGLFWYDEDLKLVPMIASEIPTVDNGGISDDGLVYRVKLRDDVTWNDGTALTADDFEYSFRRLLDPATGSPTAEYFFDIRGGEELASCYECTEDEVSRLSDALGVRAEDDRTLVFTLRAARSTFTYLLSTVAASPLRSDVIEEHGEDWTSPENMITNGPFLLTEWSPESRMVLERNSNWWGEAPELDRVEVMVMEDLNDAFNAFLAGDIDATLVSGELQPIVDDDPSLEDQNYQLETLASTAYMFNHELPPFNQLEVRKAFAMAVDRDAFAAESEAPDKAGLTWLPPEMPGYSESRGDGLGFDPEAAREALAEAGYANGNGLPTVTFAYVQENPRAQAAAEFLARQLDANLGVEIVLEPLPRDSWREQFLQGQLQLLIYGTASEYADAYGFLSGLWTCQRYEGGECTAYSGENFWHYADPEFDRLLQQAAKETDTNRRIDLYEDAESVLLDDAAAIFLGYEFRSVLVKPYVGGISHTALDWLPGELTLDKAYINQ
jgi:oligopeptide transport system substrate-binding protein